MPDPRITLTTRVHPNPLHTREEPYTVTVRLDVNAPSLNDGVVTLPLHLAIVLDRSGSMAGEKLETAKLAAARTVDRLSDDDVFTLIAFSTEAVAIVPARKVGPKQDRQKIKELIAGLAHENMTHLAKGMNLAADQLSPFRGPNVTSAFFVLTDGEAQDQEGCLALAPELLKGGFSTYAGGIGDKYDHVFLEKLCADPVEQGKYLVDHIDTSALDNLDRFLERFITHKGHVVTANVKLSVTHPRMVTLKRLHAEEHARELRLDDQQSVALPELCVGQQQRYLLEFEFTPSRIGVMRLAKFNVQYDLPAVNVSRAAAEAEAILEVTQEASAANDEVVQIVRKFQAVKMCEEAEKLLQMKNVRGATEKMKMATRKLEDIGEHEKARVLKDEIEAMEQCDPENLDLLEKKRRGTTKRISE